MVEVSLILIGMVVKLNPVGFPNPWF